MLVDADACKRRVTGSAGIRLGNFLLFVLQSLFRDESKRGLGLHYLWEIEIVQVYLCFGSGGIKKA